MVAPLGRLLRTASESSVGLLEHTPKPGARGSTIISQSIPESAMHLVQHSAALVALVAEDEGDEAVGGDDDRRREAETIDVSRFTSAWPCS